jgi:hypothetical protein
MGLSRDGLGWEGAGQGGEDSLVAFESFAVVTVIHTLPAEINKDVVPALNNL